MRRITAACACHTGFRRHNNEDNFYFAGKCLPKENDGLGEILTCAVPLDQPVCFGVFDGMGGEANGEEAAHLAALAMGERMETGKPVLPGALLDVCQVANRRICQAAGGNGGRMGSTAVLLGVCREGAYVVNVGDSRAFLWRGGALRQLSVDHTDQFLLARQKEPRRKPRLTQHLGIEPEEMVIEPAVAELSARTGDVFLLCSDGLTDMVSENEICGVLRRMSAVKAGTEDLLDLALGRGGRDNVTVILCRLEEDRPTDRT